MSGDVVKRPLDRMTVRRQLAILVAATTSLVLIAFLVPLGVLAAQVVADRAVDHATREAEFLARLVATVEQDSLQVPAIDPSGDFPLTVFWPDGTSSGTSASRTDAVLLAARGQSFVVVTDGGREVLVAVQGVPGGTAVVRAVVPEDTLHRGVARAWLILGGLGVTLLGLSVLVADRLARNVVGPLRNLADVSYRLASGQLEAQVEPEGPVELRAVGRAVNYLAGRIEALVLAERETIADLSHRLRTPLTALRLDADTLSDPGEARQIASGVDALTLALDDVIRVARDLGGEDDQVASDLVVTVTERLEFWSALAQEENRQVTADMTSGPVPVGVTEESLRALVDALLGNVFAHTPTGTPFLVRIRRTTDGTAVLTVADSGAGFDVDDPFERGYSAKASTGLGLDIVRRTAMATGGSVSASPTHSSGQGARVTVVLGGRVGRGVGVEVSR